MADLANGGEVLENYKGLLIQYCQERGLGQPTYTEIQHGSPDSPQWQVTVSYGTWIHETPEPIPGSKKFAHQVASHQVLNEINSRREGFLAGETADTIPVPVSEPVPDTTPPLEVPISLVSNALIIANERLTASQPSRYRTVTDAEFSQKLSKLTLEIVRNLLEKAEADKITFQ